MKKLLLLATLALTCRTGLPGTLAPAAELQRWAQTAKAVTIVRDDWGIAHIHGVTDADAVFGMIYAQAEDDFNRVENNYLLALGRAAEAQGESEVFRDLRMKLFIDPAALQVEYRASPDWLRALMDAWADGLNYYLATHPAVKPRVLTRFEPWMALAFSEGSIGGDIESVDLDQLKAFYGDKVVSAAPRPAGGRHAQSISAEPTGSNGFAIAPANTTSHHALLWINPHTSFYFRSEQQVSSDQGLDVYGAATWGQFFIYQGFNRHLGWMHTSSSVNCISEYLESVRTTDTGPVYRYGNAELPVQTTRIRVPYKVADGMAHKDFTVYRTRHGPVVRAAGGKWVSIRLMQAPLQALIQSYSRTRAQSLKEFRAALDLHTNSSNNTVYADADGNIAYFQANFIPRRDARFDWAQPVDGSDPATDWGPPLSVDESPLVINPPNGWIQNTNNAPWSAAGDHSPKQAAFPPYVDLGSQNPRGEHAIRMLDGRNDFTLDSLTAAAFDSDQPEFARLIPRLLAAYDRLPADAALKPALAGQIAVLRDWDHHWAADSIANTLAVLWAEDLWEQVADASSDDTLALYDRLEQRADADLLAALVRISERLTKDFGSWKTPWGLVNRFQRISPAIEQPFLDAAPSLPIPFSSARWGSLAAFGALPYQGSKKIYGSEGNSFVAAVEFGKRVRAKAISVGGQSGDPGSRHFTDQAERYASGRLRDVYFYPEDLEGHVERRYHPGP